ncbi:MAG: helix-turn-helix domain-containing protein [Planctomycetes bacterium]|nr:helix-turn-helix domain-containing protein [Planctomycetota bacterium]
MIKVTKRRNEPDRYLKFGLASSRGRPSLFASFHRHNEIELHLVETGRMTYLFSRARVELAPGALAVFWGAMPHKLIELERGTQSLWLTVPLPWFLQWDLPADFTGALMKGEVFRSMGVPRGARDADLLLQWNEDLQAGGPERRKTAVLEVEARLRRLALEVANAKPTRSKKPGVAAGAEGRVERLAAFIAERYREPLAVAQIAAAAGLNPEYATTLFRKTIGMTLVDYVTEHRISHAQRLLTTTERKVLDVALDAGFGSLSRFYAAFTNACGQTPRAFRHGLIAQSR